MALSIKRFTCLSRKNFSDISVTHNWYCILNQKQYFTKLNEKLPLLFLNMSTDVKLNVDKNLPPMVDLNNEGDLV